MKKFFILVAAVTFGLTSCGSNEFDEQMEARQVVMNKGGKADKTEKVKQTKNEKNGIMLCKNVKTGTAEVKDKSAKGPDKNAKNGVAPCTELETRSVTGPWKPFPIRHPTAE